MNIAALLLFSFAAAFYFLPALIAKSRGTKNGGSIMAINLLFGWTVLGWFAALIWACTEKIEEPAPTDEIDGTPRATALEQLSAFLARAKKQLTTPVAETRQPARTPRGKFSDRDGAASFSKQKLIP